jgi:hypothetical protein
LNLFSFANIRIVKKIDYLKIEFEKEDPIRPYEVNKFRGAVINEVGLDKVLLHNHLGENGFRHKYPLVQYKSIRNKAVIICLDQGMDQIHSLFGKSKLEFMIGGSKRTYQVDSVKMNRITLQVWDVVKNYKLRNWLPLNQENHKKYITCSNDVEKKELLKHILIGNILSMAKGLEWHVEKEILIEIEEFIEKKTFKFKEVFYLAFDLKFRCNLFFPPYIGLGKGSSIGYGVVTKNNKK